MCLDIHMRKPLLLTCFQKIYSSVPRVRDWTGRCAVGFVSFFVVVEVASTMALLRARWDCFFHGHHID